MRAPRGMESHYAHMFVDDVHSHLFPIGGEVKKDGGPAATLVVDSGADSSLIERMVTFGFGVRDTYARHEFAAAFVEWATYCAHSLIRTGRAWFELAPIRSPALSQPVGFRILPIYAGTVHRRYRWWGPYVQRVASSTLTDEDDETNPVEDTSHTAIELGRADRIFEVALPAHLREFHRAAVRLADLGEDHFPSFMMPSFAAGPTRVPYDFDVFRRTEQVAVAAATRRIGWYGRGTFNDYQTEYYSMARRLQFERMLHDLREVMFVSANKILERAGAAIGFRAHIAQGALPTVDDINHATSMLEEGQISAAALLERFSFY
ncbi:MAG TPA: hypothetical protein VGM50_02495 [Gemmatimonadaceae bacterium]|jgi:hypothetical protein